ncbi:sensor histidine kinase [Rufibacter sp. LB8]|uniref:sensor histidine kinase n=1 Tax=Rufibacter sp. LB8 TaxID=2777781 RepID=UPI00178C1BDF|nr:sensor histidine kinase [Rufibacter sp. LB8]
MLETPSEVVTVLLAGTAILLLLVFFIVSFLFIYQKRQLLHIKEKQQLKLDYERAINESQLEIQEETLRYVGRELHDNIGQILSLVKLHLHDSQNPDQVGHAKDLLSGAIADVRGLSKTLNTDWAEDISLPELLSRELDKLEKSNVLKTEFLYDGFDCPLHSKNKLIVFRVFQESLNNCIKHAQATWVTVNFHLAEGEESCILEITDNGVGFEPAQASAGSGLTNMRKRMEVIQGQVEIVSRLQRGTRVEVRFPCQQTTTAPPLHEQN